MNGRRQSAQRSIFFEQDFFWGHTSFGCLGKRGFWRVPLLTSRLGAAATCCGAMIRVVGTRELVRGAQLTRTALKHCSNSLFSSSEALSSVGACENERRRAQKALVEKSNELCCVEEVCAVRLLQLFSVSQGNCQATGCMCVCPSLKCQLQ